MSGENQAGQDAATVVGEATQTEVAQTNATTTDAQTDGALGGESVPAAAKTFTQAELDDIVRREKAKAESKAERRVLRTIERIAPPAQQQPQQTQQRDNTPRRDQYASDEDYLDAKVDWKLSQRDAVSQQERQQQQAQSTLQKTEDIYAKAEKVPGFDRDVFDDLPLSKAIVETLIESDQAPQLMAYMASNPEAVAKIAGMSPARQAAELGKIEATLASKPPVKTSRAPEPINTVGGARTPIQHDLGSADMATYMELRKKQGARWGQR